MSFAPLAERLVELFYTKNIPHTGLKHPARRYTQPAFLPVRSRAASSVVTAVLFVFESGSSQIPSVQEASLLPAWLYPAPLYIEMNARDNVFTLFTGSRIAVNTRDGADGGIDCSASGPVFLCYAGIRRRERCKNHDDGH